MSGYTIEELRPFGTLVRAHEGASLLAINPASLDKLIQKSKLVLLRGFNPLERDKFLSYCRSFPNRSLLEWDFGPVMEMQERPDPKNYLFSREAVPYHWDGAFHRVATYLAFSCVEAPNAGADADAGGETLFCDTERVWESASEAEQDSWRDVELTYETEKLAHYGGKITGPLVQLHPETGHVILRYAEPVETKLNPVKLTVKGSESLVSTMQERIYDPRYSLSHQWQQGDFLFADNHSLIHGRRAFAQDSPRHLRRIQIV